MDLNLHNIPRDPFVFLEKWLEDSRQAGNKYFDAMTLATVGEQGAPNTRVVLYKGRDGEKIRLFTNYESPKAKELERDPRCTLVFFWPESHRQVRIKGLASK